MATAAPDEPTDFSTFLRHHRTRARLTQRELADLAAVSARTIRNLESGREGRPRPDTVHRLADAMRLAPESRAWLHRAVGLDPVAVALGGMRDTVPCLDEGVAAAPPVDRGREVGSVLDVLRGGRSRVVTVNGFGGVGKSCLAAAVVRAGWSTDRVSWFWLRSGRLGEGVVADTITRWRNGFLAGDDRAVDDLVHVVGDRPAVLVLDDIEPAGEARGVDAALTDVLRQCPRLRVVETSRRLPRRPNGHVVALRPLRVPDPATPVDQEDESRSAVAFLVARITATLPEFDRTGQNEAALAETCRLLDGLPKALASAATWYAFYTPEEVAAKAEADPGTLAAPLGADPGKSWVAEAFADAYECLSRRQVEMLRRLSALALPWTVDQVAEQFHRAGAELIETLHNFLTLGLIRPASGGRGPRSFTVLNVIRPQLA